MPREERPTLALFILRIQLSDGTKRRVLVESLFQVLTRTKTALKFFERNQTIRVDIEDLPLGPFRQVCWGSRIFRDQIFRHCTPSLCPI